MSRTTDTATVPTTPTAPRRPVRRRGPRRLRSRLVLYVLALFAFIFFAGPLLWMLSSALKSQPEVLARPPVLVPEEFHWSNFVEVFETVPFGRYMLNSAFVATTVTVVSLLFHSMAAYSLARLDYPGRNVIFVAILSTLMIPFTVILIPLFIVVDYIGWVDTYWGLIVPMIPHAFGIFLLRQFYLGMPRELEEAAIVDGASLVKVYTKIVLPLSRPIMAALGIFFFLANWNRFLWPLVVTHNRDLFVVQLGMQQFSGERGTQFQLIMAASTIAILPVLILFFVLQRRLIEGIKLTGLKG
jgi:multiple sugar transport system permease protein